MNMENEMTDTDMAIDGDEYFEWVSCKSSCKIPVIKLIIPTTTNNSSGVLNSVPTKPSTSSSLSINRASINVVKIHPLLFV